MTIRSVDCVQVTGLAASGTTDDLGSWNTSVSLDTFASVPSGATGVVLRVVNTSSSNRWGGVRTPGKTTPVIQSDLTTNGSVRDVICALGSSGTIDLYAENTTDVKFFILGYTGSEWSFTNIDSPTETLTTTGSVFASRTVTSAPSGAVAAMLLPANIASWEPTGAASSLSANFSSSDYTIIVKLDGSKAFRLKSAGTVTVYATISSGVTFPTWLDGSTSLLSLTWDQTWRSGSLSNSGKGAALVHLDSSSAASLLNFRKTGSTFDTPASGIGSYSSRSSIAPLSASGTFEYIGETGGTASAYVIAWFDDISTSTTPVLMGASVF